MTEKKERGRKALDVGSNLAVAAGTLVDMGATGGVLAGGKLLWDAVTAGIGWRRRRQAEAFLARLAEALGEADTAALAAELDQAGENEVWETIEQGFREMMAAINETAKRCIALLVADYVVRQELPDRDFQVLGRLLADSDEDILEALLGIVRQLERAVRQIPAGQTAPDIVVLGIGPAPDQLLAMLQYRVNGLVPEIITSEGEPCPENIQMVAYFVSQHGLADLPPDQSGVMMWHNDAMPTFPGVRPVLHVQSRTIYRFQRLRQYLEPVFFESRNSGV